MRGVTKAFPGVLANDCVDCDVAHRDPGHGIIGAGLVRAPRECFKEALVAFGHAYGLG